MESFFHLYSEPHDTPEILEILNYQRGAIIFVETRFNGGILTLQLKISPFEGETSVYPEISPWSFKKGFSEWGTLFLVLSSDRWSDYSCCIHLANYLYDYCRSFRIF